MIRPACLDRAVGKPRIGRMPNRLLLDGGINHDAFEVLGLDRLGSVGYGNGGCPGPTRQTEPKRPARNSQSISAARRTSGWRRWMIILQRRAKQHHPDDRRAAGSWVLPQQQISPSKKSRSAQIRYLKTKENRNPRPAFLQNRIIAQAKSPRQINRFRIPHGRLPMRPRNSAAIIPLFWLRRFRG